MRLPIYLWNTVWGQLGRKVICVRRKARAIGVEKLEDRQMLAVTTSSVLVAPSHAIMSPSQLAALNWPIASNIATQDQTAQAATAQPAQTGAIAAPTLDDRLLTQLKRQQLLAAELAQVDSAESITLPAGEFETGLGTADVADLQSMAEASFVGPIPATGYLDDYIPPSFMSAATPTTLVFQGQMNSDNTLSLNLANLPRNTDGTSQIRTIVFHGGTLGRDNTLKLAGGRFQRERYYATGPDSGILTLDDLKVIFTDLKPVIDTNIADEYDVYDYCNANPDYGDFINIGDGENQEADDGYGGFQTVQTLRISSVLNNFEEVTLANKNSIVLVTQGPKAYVTLGYGIAPFYVYGQNQMASVLAIDAETDESTYIAAQGLYAYGGMALWVGGNANLDAGSGTHPGGPMSVYGGSLSYNASGSDTLTVTDSSVSSVSSYTNNSISYSGLQALTVSSGYGSTFNIVSTPTSSTAFNAYSGGNNTFNIGSAQNYGTLDAIAQPITIYGYSSYGTNTVNIYDQASGSAYTYGIAGS